MNKKKKKVNWMNPDTTAENEILPGWLKWVWTARGLAFSINVVLMLQVTYFCTDILSMPAALVGTLLLSSKIVDALTDLFFGYIIDRTKTRWGKARPYEIFIVLMWAGTVLLFSAPNFGLVGKAIYVFILYALVNSVCSTFVQASDPVYMSRAIRSDKNKMSVTSFQGAFIMIGATAVGIIIPQLIKNIGTTKSGWTMIAVLFAVPLTLIGSIRMFTVKEVAADERNEGGQSHQLSIKRAFLMLTKNKLVLILCMLTLLNSSISAVTQSTANYYFKWIFGDVGMASLVSLPALITPFILIFTPVLSRKFGTGKLLTVGFVSAVLGYIIRLAFGTNLATILLGTTFASIGMIPIGTLLSIYEMECMDYGEWKTGVRVEGMITSTVGFAGKVGSAFGSGILGILMGISGYVSSDTATSQSSSALTMIAVLFNIVPLILAAIGVILTFYYTIDKEREEMQKALSQLYK